MIPILSIPLLWWRWSAKLAIWELLILVGTPIVLTWGAKASCEAAQIHATEYWGSWVSTAEYYEDWDEEVSCRHPKYRTETRTDSKGNTYTEQVFDGYEHLYDVDYHPPYWQVNDSLGTTISTDQVLFESLSKRWKSRKFVDLHRSYHSNDGDKYVATWDAQPATLEPVTTSHSYENRVQASKSIVNYREVNPEDYDLYEHPKISGFYRQHSILGKGGATHVEAENKLDYLNATLGSTKQVRMYILIFKDKPLEAALEQEAFWKGGHKNELVTCVGVDGSFEVKWAYIFSWSKSETLKVEMRDFLAQQKTLDLAAYVDWLGPQVVTSYIRFDWHTFDYLTVEPPGWIVTLVFFLTILVNGGLAIWTVNNRHNNDLVLSGPMPSICRKCYTWLKADKVHKCSSYS